LAQPGAALRTSGVWYSLGDSISADGGRTINGASAVDVNYYRFSWQRWAEFRSAAKFRFGGAFATGGYTIQQIKSVHLPQLLAWLKPGDVVSVLMGQNNLGTANAQDLIDYADILDSIITTGALPVVGVLTPSIFGRTYKFLNAGIQSLALARGLPICDFAAPLIDPATGVWKSTWTRDGVHPGEIGARSMGYTFGDVLNTLPVSADNTRWLARTSQGYGPDRATQTGGNSNPIFDAAIGGEWSIGTLTPSYSAASYGRALTLTNSGTANTERNARLTVSTAQAGDKFRIAGYLTTSVEAFGGYFKFGVLNGGGASLWDQGRNNAQGPNLDLSRSMFCFDVVHFGTSGLLVDFLTNSVSSAGASVTIEQLTVTNLTALGIA
jgi:hypothetical protein